jgi:molybdopterin converting factor small subunit
VSIVDGGLQIRPKMVLVKVQFEGGLQNDFQAPSGVSVTIPDGTTLGQLPQIVSSQFGDPSRPVRFVNASGSVLPGILIMLNEVDSAVDGLGAVLGNNDVVTFISTLHGG